MSSTNPVYLKYQSAARQNPDTLCYGDYSTTANASYYEAQFANATTHSPSNLMDNLNFASFQPKIESSSYAPFGSTNPTSLHHQSDFNSYLNLQFQSDQVNYDNNSFRFKLFQQLTSDSAKVASSSISTSSSTSSSSASSSSSFNYTANNQTSIESSTKPNQSTTSVSCCAVETGPNLLKINVNTDDRLNYVNKNVNMANTKTKKSRVLFSQWQINELEKLFKKQKYVTSNERELMAKRLKLQANQVKIWFQNRRYKIKKQSEAPKETS